jgi:receptor protein-tyrosine kinase
MSRVHDALRRAEQSGQQAGASNLGAEVRETFEERPLADPNYPATPQEHQRESRGLAAATALADDTTDWAGLLSRVQEIPLQIAPEAHLINLDRPHEVPGEEFRSLRTRLNHVQGQQDIHSLIVTSASPAEGKTFTAVNFALAQAQLAENPVLLADLDLRRPIIHHLFQSERGPGFSDYLIHGAPLESVIRRVGNTNLYLMPAGTAVKNPLELLNLRQVRTLLANLPRVFNWVIADTPPLLFSADANLLATLCDATLIVVRIGSTTYDNIIRAMQSLCENNVIGIVANGARATELYSKYTYYYSKRD